MNHQHIADMLRMQDKLNSVIDPNWLTADYPWHRAILVEATEALDHYGWKWWKAKGDVDTAQLKLELVDIWHFAMSSILVIQSGSIPDAAVEVTTYFDALETNADAYGEISNVATEQLFDLLAGSAAMQRQLNGPAFNQLMVRFGLTWDELYTTYVAKNVLNLFRQANGYKEGTYIKNWDGSEDNVVLASLMAAFPAHSPEMLYDALDTHYQALLVFAPMSAEA
jgi:dimeric dUTPase (all-alpha-NTP-PPase superfamily)